MCRALIKTDWASDRCWFRVWASISSVPSDSWIYSYFHCRQGTQQGWPRNYFVGEGGCYRGMEWKVRSERPSPKNVVNCELKIVFQAHWKSWKFLWNLVITKLKVPTMWIRTTAIIRLNHYVMEWIIIMNPPYKLYIITILYLLIIKMHYCTKVLKLKITLLI